MDGDTIDDTFSGLIGYLYDAALDPSQWRTAANRIAAALDSTSAVVKLHASDERVQLLQATDNLRIGEPRRAWAEEWHRNDLWVKHSLAFGVSRIVTDEMLVSADEQRHSGFYQVWLAELGIHHMVGAVFPADHGGVGVLGIHRPHRAGRYSEPERRKVAVLLPHLQRALRIRQLFAGTAMAESGAAAALDRLGRPVVIVNRVCKLIYANRSAEDVVRDNPEVEVSGNRLALRNAALNERLVALVQGPWMRRGASPRRAADRWPCDGRTAGR